MKIFAYLALFSLLFFAFGFMFQKTELKFSPVVDEVLELEDPDDLDDSGLLSYSEIQAEQSDSALAKYVTTLLERYHPPNAFVLLMDAKSGQVLAWGQRKDDKDSEYPDFFKRDSFPAASLAKIATAAAALESGKEPQSEIPKIGRNSTLYKRQIFPKENYRGSMISLENAFAISNNPAMGITGIELGKDKMQDVAERLGFVNFNYPDSGYGLAESASGFTKRNMVSPLQAALAIRTLVFSQPGKKFKKETYSGMRELFLRVVENGTARRYIKKSVRSRNRDSLYIGGKTGSLSGDSPKGRYDWFAGFAQKKNDPEKAVIVVVMQAHGKLRYQHSTMIAGLLINEWAR
jgi:cell division protein FtsI/penicillin-binding protein 2